MKTILVCTDFSPTGNNAVKFAVQYASSSKYNLVVFHVVRMPKFSPTISEAVFLELEKKEESIQKQKLVTLLDKIYRDLHLKKNARKVSVVAKNGIFVTETLVAAAENHKADLIIVGTHGATGLKLFGSISSEIIFKASAPVLAIPPRYRYRKLKTIVYSSDLKNLVNELRCISPIASSEKAVIEILNLNFGKGNAKPIIDEKDLMKQVKYKRLKVIVQKERQGLTIIEQLQRYLKNRKPEIFVMFPEERSLFDKLFVRSKTEELVYQIKLPLLTFLKSRVK
jgi:nucleotide-binding universal stress UspA family protein